MHSLAYSADGSSWGSAVTPITRPTTVFSQAATADGRSAKLPSETPRQTATRAPFCAPLGASGAAVVKIPANAAPGDIFYPPFLESIRRYKAIRFMNWMLGQQNNQIASFYTGAMAHAGELSMRKDSGCHA